ncbi:MAG: O-antigen ligase family protein, partial [Desulfobacterota bacterium]|nr:O-antigen ligase family protein [Thermodesulfobacteriota bacterium]
LLFLVFQILPLPPSVLRFLSPEAWVIGEKSLPASLVVISGEPIGPWFSLASYVHPVRLSIVRLTVYALFFVGLAQMLTSTNRIRTAVLCILLLGSFEALYGMIQTFSGNEHIWWVKKLFYRGDATGTYVNRNHFAGLMEITLMLATVYAGALTERRKKTASSFARRSPLRARLAGLLKGEARFNKRVLVLFSAVLMGLGLLFSASRGAMLGAAGGLLCMGLLFVFRQGHRAKGLLVLLLFLLTSAYALRMGVEQPLERFRTFDASFEVRARYAQRAFQLFQEFTLAGVGVGNFRYAYPKFQAPEDTKTLIDHAHNDYVQFLAEAGVVGFFILGLGLLYYLFQIGRLWAKRHDPFAVTLGVAPLAAMTAIAIHSYSDFNLHYMTNVLMILAVMAIGFSGLHLERHHAYEKSVLRFHVLPMRVKGLLLVAPLLLAVLWSGVRAGSHFMAEDRFRAAAGAGSKADPLLLLEQVERAAAWDPGEAKYWWEAALRLRERRAVKFKDAEWSDQDRNALQGEIIEALENAVSLNPLHAEYHLRLAWEYTPRWNEADSRKRWMPASDLSMERAAYFAGTNNPYLHILMGDYWLMRSKTVYPGNPLWETAIAKAGWHYLRNLSVETGADRTRMKDQIIKNIWVHYPDQEFVNRILGE